MTDSDYKQSCELVLKLASIAHLVDVEGALVRILEAQPCVVEIVPTKHTRAAAMLERYRRLFVALRPFKAEAGEQISGLFRKVHDV